MDEDANGQFYINPFDGNKIADIPPKSVFFEFLTNFHRSLFLKTPGRIFIGISSGASLAAVKNKQDEMAPGAKVLVFSYDTGERYLSIDDLFEG